MIVNRKNTQVNVFAGSPWEAASVMTLLTAAYIKVSACDKRNSIMLSVPSEDYAAAVRVLSNRY